MSRHSRRNYRQRTGAAGRYRVERNPFFRFLAKLMERARRHQ